MPFGLGLPELLIILVVLLLLFGAKRLPEMGRSLGKGMREFKDAITNDDDEAAATSTPPAPAPPVELPSPSADSSAQRVEAEQGEREHVS
jgi:sec-independent protein translocase protein TatA